MHSPYHRRVSERDETEATDRALVLAEGAFNSACDQWAAALRPLAVVGGQFARACVEEGFSREESFALVKSWAEAHFDSYNDAPDNTNDESPED